MEPFWDAAGPLVDELFRALEWAFSNRLVAPAIILPLFVLAALAMGIRAGWRARPYLRAVKARSNTIASALGRNSTPVEERRNFAARFDGIAAALTRGGRHAEPLIRAWHEFHESIVDETEEPIRNTVRPQVYFARAVPSLNFLAFWSNIFVGLGLLFTFMGIVVALNSAGKNMGDTQATQSALQALLAIAGAKFFASIGGLIASLLVRAIDAHYHKRIRIAVDRLCSLLERGLLYVPPQRLAAQQLQELRAQTAQFERFNTELALSIGEQISSRFHAAMAPIASSIGDLSNRMSDFGENVSQGLGQGAADAVSAAASGELRALGQALGELQTQLRAVGEHVGSTGEGAARQIKLAGEDFAGAARDIRAAFEQLGGRVQAMGDTLVAQNDAAAARQNDALSGTIARLNEVQASTADAIAEAVRRLGSASEETARDLQARIGDVVRSATAEAQEALKDMLAAAGAGFQAASGELVASVRRSAEQIAGVANSLESGRSSAEGLAAAFQRTADGATGLVGLMSDAAAGLTAAARPLSAASQTVETATGRLVGAVQDQATALSSALDRLKELGAGIEETQSAASAAWHDYRARFEGVDQALAKSLDGISQALADALRELRQFAVELDTQMAKVVDRLATSLNAIEDQGQAISEYAEALQQERPKAAE